jgi:hypothetical protein
MNTPIKLDESTSGKGGTRMKSYILYGAIAAMGLSSAVIAEEAQKEGQDKHPPTEAVGSEVPTMKSGEDTNKHPPTEIVGDAVPTMKDKEEKKN